MTNRPKTQLVSRKRHFGRLALIPLMTFVVIGSVQILLWRLSSHQEFKARHAEATAEAEQVATRLEQYIQVRLGLVEGLRAHWNDGEPLTEESYREHANLLLDGLGGLQALNWVDADGVIRWVHPEEPNRLALGRDLTQHPVAGDVLRLARDTGNTQITPSITLYQGGRGFVAYVPVEVAGKTRGFLNAVFRTSPLIEASLASHVVEGYRFLVREGEQALHSSFDADTATPDEFSVQAEVGVGSRIWSVQMWPTQNSLASRRPGGNEYLLAIGVLLALLLAGVTWWLFLVQERERRSAQDLRDMVETAHEGIWAIDAESNTTFVNRRMAEIFGYSPDEMLGTSMFAFMDDEGRRQANQNVERRRSGISEVHGFRFKRKDGTDVWTEMSTNPMVDDRGNYVGALAMVTDITQRRRAEREQRANEERLALAAQGADLGLWDWDPRTDELVFDDRWASMLGYAREELTSHFDTMRKLIHPDDLGDVLELLGMHLDGHTDAFESEHRMRSSEDEWRWILSRGKVVDRDDRHRPLRVTGTHLDLTERRNAEYAKLEFEARMRHAQKLESLGMLSGGIAHDFNNILMTVLGNVNLARRDLGSSPASCDHALGEIEVAAQRAAELCRQMLAYSGRGKSEVKAVDMNAVVHEMEQLLAVTISKKATVRRVLDPDLPTIDGDPAQIGQVVMNLILNSSEALEGQVGTIVVRTGHRRFDADALQNGALGAPVSPGEFVVLEVEDTGAGMDSEIKSKLLEPFFTTKFTGRGLGMAAVAGIVRTHGGEILVATAPGEGTTVSALFPLGIEAARAETQRTKPRKSGGGCILVVDDEEPLRTLLERLLEPEGYEVLSAADGAEAVDRVRTEGARIDAVLLDLTMPRMDGREALVQLRQYAPTVPVLLCSGFDPQEVSERFESEPPDAYIQKPYQPDELLGTLADLLDRSESPAS